MATATPADSGPAPGRADLGLPSSAVQSVRLARYQFRDYLNSRRFILMLAIVAALGAIFTALVGYFRPAALLSTPDTFYGALWANGVPIVIVFAGVIFGGDAIAGEFQNRTGYFLMGLPVRRAAVYAGKYLAALAAALISVLAFAAILIGNGVFYFGIDALPLAFLASLLLAIAYLLALLGATFLFSSLFKTSTYAVLVVAVLFIFGFGILQSVVTGLVKIEPWFLISYASPVIGYPFASSLPAHVTVVRAASGAVVDTLYAPTYLEGIGIMLGYFLLTAVGGLALFEREEFS